tara:strand:- start:5896 stop:6804 length:909 start_codon:yes stop_codon:yes gene_type:complete
MNKVITWRGPRYKSWIKNSLLLVGVIFGGVNTGEPVISNAAILIEVAFGILLFCLTSTIGYAVNDLLDQERDLKNPIHKSKRYPIFSSLYFFLLLGLVIFIGLENQFIRKEMLFILSVYFLMTCCYSKFLKNIPIVEIIALSLHFLLRILAGTWAVGISISEWLVVAGFMMALLLSFGKRCAEFRLAKGNFQFRPVLSSYKLEYLIGISRSLALMNLLMYCLYSLNNPERGLFFLVVTLPFVAFGLFRYLLLLEREDMVKTPEEMLLGDKSSITNLLLWLLIIVLMQGYPSLQLLNMVVYLS